MKIRSTDHTIRILVYLSSLLVYCVFACGRLDKTFQHQEYICGRGANVPVVQFIRDNGKPWHADSVRTYIVQSDGSLIDGPGLTEKGCLREITIQWKSIFVGSKVDLRSTLLHAEILKSRKDLVQTTLEKQAVRPPRRRCLDNVVFNSSMNLKAFIDFTDVPFAGLYQVKSELRVNGSSVVTFDPFFGTSRVTVPLNDIPNGDYTLLLSYSSKALNMTPVQFQCMVSIDHGTLIVTLGDVIKHWRNYFGTEYGVVEPGYHVNFYVEGSTDNYDIEYCIFPVNPKTWIAPKNSPCKHQKLHRYETQRTTELSPGFWMVAYRTIRHGEQSTPWQTEHLMVKKVCTGTFRDVDQITDQGCTDIDGDIILGAYENEALILRGPEIDDQDMLALEMVSEITGDLKIVETKVTSLEALKHLTMAGSIEITNNPRLKRIDLQRLKGVHKDLILGGVHPNMLDDNPWIYSVSGFNQLSFVGHNLEISYLKSVQGFDSLQTIGGSIRLKVVESIPSSKDTNGNNENSYEPTDEGFDTRLHHHSQKGLMLGSFKERDFSVSGFRNLSFVGTDFSLWAIKSIKGFDRMRVIGGSFSIVPDSRSNILKGPENLEHVGGQLLIEFCNLTKLSGFNALKYVGALSLLSNKSQPCTGGLKLIDENEENDLTVVYVEPDKSSYLSKLEWFKSLRQVEHLISNGPAAFQFSLPIRVRKSLTLESTLLTDLSELDGQIIGTATLIVKANSNLKTVTRWKDFLPTNVYIRDNSNLESIGQLSTTPSLRNLVIENNPVLFDIIGLTNLVEVNGSLHLVGSRIKSLEPLRSLRQITRQFKFVNEEPVDLSPLHEIESAGWVSICKLSHMELPPNLRQHSMNPAPNQDQLWDRGYNISWNEERSRIYYRECPNP